MPSTRQPPIRPSRRAAETAEHRSPGVTDVVATTRAQRGIQSVEVGGLLLQALADQGRPMSLKALSGAAGMSPAKAHPYLVSFGKIGLIEQDAASGHYGLGPLAMQLGLISLQQHDPVRLATGCLPGLAQTLGLTVALAVWGQHGPTIVRTEEAPGAVHVSMRHGTVLNLRGTASGLLFAAHLPPEVVGPVWAAQSADAARFGRRRPRSAAFPPAELRHVLDEIRTQGCSRAVDAAVPGIGALAAPVFDQRGAMALALTAIGPGALVDSRFDGPMVPVLRQAAQALSTRLGAPTAAAPGASAPRR